MKIVVLVGIVALIGLLILHSNIEPTSMFVRDFSESDEYIYSEYAKPVQVVDYCERVVAPVDQNFDMCVNVGMERCCQAYNIPGCSRGDIAVWPSVCVQKCMMDVHNQCRTAGGKLQARDREQRVPQLTGEISGTQNSLSKILPHTVTNREPCRLVDCGSALREAYPVGKDEWGNVLCMCDGHAEVYYAINPVRKY